MPYEVKLAVFEGPIDLLLHLITRQRVDIYDVSISAITEEYLAVVHDMETPDLELATGFLVVAATLLELKSARLLPSRLGEEADSRLLEERDLLLGRLVECATYREAGAYLGASLAEGERYFPRVVPLELHFVPAAPDLLARVSPAQIAAAAATALEPKPREDVDVSHLEPTRASVRDAILELASVLGAGLTASFESLCGRSSSRMDVVVRFLALLELFKAGAVEVEQTGSFGTIVARWTGAVRPEDVVEEADEYVAEEVRR